MEILWRSVNLDVFGSLTASDFVGLGILVYLYSGFLRKCAYIDDFCSYSQRLNNNPTSIQWCRFLQRCKLIKVFNDDVYGPCRALVHRSTSILLHPPCPAYFPHLTTLRIDVCHLGGPFCSESVVELSVLVSSRNGATSIRSIRLALRSLPLSMPCVQILRLDGNEELRCHENELCRVLCRMRSLRQIILAPAAVSHPILDSLAALPLLESVNVSESNRAWHRAVEIYDKGGLSSMPATLFQPVFPSLTKLTLTTSWTRYALRFVKRPNFPMHSLSELIIRVPYNFLHRVCGSDIREFVDHIRPLSPHLRRLVLRFAPNDDVPESRWLQPLHFHDIRPLLSFPAITDLAVDDVLPLTFDPDDADELAASSARLRTLWLNPFPSLHRPSSLPISCLQRLAENSPALERLGLYMAMDDDFVMAGHPCRFRSLKELFLGWSTPIGEDDGREASIRHQERIAIFLARVTHTSTVFTTPWDFIDEEVYNIVGGDMRPPWFLGEDSVQLALDLSIDWKMVFGLIRRIRLRGEPDLERYYFRTS